MIKKGKEKSPSSDTESLEEKIKASWTVTSKEEFIDLIHRCYMGYT